MQLDPENHEQILNFCNQYGLLGLGQLHYYRERARAQFEKELQKPNTVEQQDVNAINDGYLRYEDKYVREINYKLNNELIADIQQEIRAMHAILLTLDAIRNKSLENLRNSLRLLWQTDQRPNELPLYTSQDISNMENLVFLKTDNDSNPFSKAFKNIANRIKNQFINTSEDNYVDAYGNYLRCLNVDSLLTTMYLMLHLDLADKQLPKRCENETCQQFFMVNKDHLDQKYHDPGCARAQAQREYRRRYHPKCKTT